MRHPPPPIQPPPLPSHHPPSRLLLEERSHFLSEFYFEASKLCSSQHIIGHCFSMCRLCTTLHPPIPIYSMISDRVWPWALFAVNTTWKRGIRGRRSQNLHAPPPIQPRTPKSPPPSHPVCFRGKEAVSCQNSDILWLNSKLCSSQHIIGHEKRKIYVIEFGLVLCWSSRLREREASAERRSWISICHHPPSPPSLHIPIRDRVWPCAFLSVNNWSMLCERHLRKAGHGISIVNTARPPSPPRPLSPPPITLQMALHIGHL